MTQLKPLQLKKLVVFNKIPGQFPAGFVEIKPGKPKRSFWQLGWLEIKNPILCNYSTLTGTFSANMRDSGPPLGSNEPTHDWFKDYDQDTEHRNINSAVPTDQ